MFSLLGFIGPMELVVVGILVLLVFGSSIPRLMRSMGQGVNEFKKGLKEPEHETVSAKKPSDPGE